jgi:hypothetical protein
MLFDSVLAELGGELRADFNTALKGLLATARTRLEGALAEFAKELIKGLVEVTTQKAELSREIKYMHTHKEMQEGLVVLNIGGRDKCANAAAYPAHIFFDAYFSGRYAQDVCEDGSIFVDRDGEHFSHVLEYMRDGVLSVAEPRALPSVSLLLALKNEFNFYCIEPFEPMVEHLAEQPAEPEPAEMAYVMGADDGETVTSRMERYDALSGQWSAITSMSTARRECCACVVAREIYVTGGRDLFNVPLSSVEKYSPSTDTWTFVAPLPAGRTRHAAVAVGSAMYVLGSFDEPVGPTSGVL